MGDFFLASNLQVWAGPEIFGHRRLCHSLVRSELEAASPKVSEVGKTESKQAIDAFGLTDFRTCGLLFFSTRVRRNNA